MKRYSDFLLLIYLPFAFYGSDTIVSICMLSHVWLFATLWTITRQAPLHIGFSKQDHWSGLPFPFRGSSWPRDQTRVSCVSWTDRQILYQCVTWEALVVPYFNILKIHSQFYVEYINKVTFLYTSFAKFTYYFLILRNSLEFCCFGDSLQFSKWTIMSHAKKRNFYFFLHSLHSFYFFFVLYYAVWL